MSSPLIRASLLSLPLVVVSAAQAADEKPTVLPKIQVAETVDEGYKASVANAAKTDTPLLDVPQSISVITRQTLDDVNAQNIGDAVQYVPGITMAQGEGNRETPVIRGNATTGDFFLDGMRDDVQ